MINKSKKIAAEISTGELFDKISILEIKLEKIKDKNSQIEILSKSSPTDTSIRILFIKFNIMLSC